MKKQLWEAHNALCSFKITLAIKLSTFLILLSIFSIQAKTFSQDEKLSFEISNAPISEVLSKIEKDSKYSLLFNHGDLNLERLVSIKAKEESVQSILHRLFSGTNIDYVLRRNKIILRVNNQKSNSEKLKVETIKIEEIQNFTISGTVKDKNGLPLTGANILEKGTTNGVQADFDGYFELEIKGDNAVIQVSYLGFASKEISVNDNRNFDVVLEEDAQALDAVVVVGYGTVLKKDLTGSVGSVNISETLKTPVATVDQAIQGRVSGVFVTSVNGSPGSNTTIRIRGGNSITAGNEPLYVVDGFVSESDILSSLNPNDIESIDILKDASAISIYGARGSNGVVLITTKIGSVGKSQVSASIYTGIQSVARKLDVLGIRDYIDFVNAGEVRLGNEPAFSQENIVEIGNGTDWQDEITREAIITNVQLAVQGGSEKTKYYLSGSHFYQDGIVIGNTFKRNQVRLNLTHKASDFFEIGSNFNLSRVNEEPERINFGATINPVLSYQPTVSVLDEDGNFTTTQSVNGNNFDNPIARTQFESNETIDTRVFSNSYVQLNLMEDLTWKSTFGVTLRNRKQNNFESSQLPLNLVANQPGSAGLFNTSSTAILTENTLNYKFDLGENHRFSLLGGFTFQREETQVTNTIVNATLTDALGVYGSSLANPEDTFTNSTYNAFRFFSVIGRVNYSLLDKYLFTLTARRDGSSRFGVNNRYAFFPSAAFAWRLSDEKFIEDLDIFSSLKFRASYGRSGNSNGIGSFQRFQALGTTFTSLGRGVREAAVFNDVVANDDLKWETTDQLDLGLEVGVLKGRLSFELDYYFKKTKDLLFTRELASQTGFSNRLENIGSLQNKGFDFSVNAVIVDKENFQWNSSLNISTYENEILDIGSDNFIDTNTLGVNVAGATGQLRVGSPLGIFTGFETNGIYQNQAQVDEDGFTNGYTPGELRFVDQNGDGTITIADDLTVIGDSNPDFFGGWNNTFNYKGFELSSFLQFVYGNDIYNIPKTAAVRSNSGTAYAQFANAWTPENTVTNIPAAQSFNPQSSNSFNVEDGSFLRLKTLQLAYNFTGEQTKLPFSNLKLYLTGNNLFLLTSDDFTGDDPEANFFGQGDLLRGYYNAGYPAATSYVLGLDIQF